MNSRFFVLIISLLLAPLAHAQYEIKGGATNLLDSRRAGGSATVLSGAVDAITVRGGGAGYVAVPAVTVGPPANGITATATAVLTDGVVTSITVNNGGSGYGSVPPTITLAPPTTPTGTAVTTSQYAGQGNTSSTAGPNNAALTTSPILGITAGRYPRASDVTVPAAPVVTIVLERASMGHSFASGVPRYMMGEEIQRPLVTWSGETTAQSYWRAQPVQPGELFSSAYVANLNGAGQPLSPMGLVNVTSSSTSSATVTVASVPSGLSNGATLLGARVNVVDGLTITLAGAADTTISTSTAKTFSPPQTCYYSPHARKVFATQPGRVTVTWVSSVPDTSAPGESTATYKFRTEVFSVSSASSQTPRMICWTEKSFNAPIVKIPTGHIVAVNPVYNTFMPSHVAHEFVPVGYNPNNNTAPPAEPRTLWFDNGSGQAALHAYNLEGRIFVEYLGALQQGGGTGVHEFLGADIVDVKMVAESATIETKLGQQLRPRQEAAQNGDDQLLASVVFDTTNVSKPLYGTTALANGTLVYHAERENDNPDKIVIYWLEEKDASIYYLTPPAAPNLAIRWPKYLRKYTQVWPTFPEFQPVTVTGSGSGMSNGPQFDAAHLPQVIFQDDPAETEVSIDVNTQRLLTDFTRSSDKTSRTLLKFLSTSTPWYVPLYIQSQDKLGSPAVVDPDGAGPLTGSDAVTTINDLNADGVADLSATVNVGQRIEPPSSAYSVAGYIASGRNYYPAGYINPFINGVKAAEAGAIIPVNALDGQNQLTVWWFKQVVAPNANFASFYLPSVVGHYTVVYPTSPAPPEIVIASGIGTGDLGPSQQLGSIYVQNDSAQIGFNPNEEHALMVAGRAYALRDDLNDAMKTSSPYVLLAYTNPTDRRPSIDAYKVVRSNFTYPLTYNAIAGTKAQPPMPLAALPPAFDSNGKVLNCEVTGTADNATGEKAPAAYSSFTFRDRQGYDWTYRGAHAKTSASATASLSGGGVSDIAISVKGAGYATAPVVSIAPPTSGTTAEATAIVSDDGQVTEITLTSTGSGYTAPPEVSIAPPVSFGMQYYYNSLPGFFEPSLALAKQRAVGTIMPFIADTGSNVPVTLTYVPKWPDDATLPIAQQKIVPVLETAETLTLAKASAIAGALPQVRSATSAQVYYQQSIANTGSSNNSVLLHDPTRAKTYALTSSGFSAIPATVLTSDYAGKTYFQKLPPHLQQRFYFDANTGSKGTLTLTGEFIDEIAGEDYINLNVLGTADLTELKNLCPSTDTANKSKWDAAIDGLSTQLETFSESGTVPGTYVVDASKDHRAIDKATLADITDPDTAVDSYALSATGKGTGYVTMVFGNGEAFTDSGDPVTMQIIKVDSTLYKGDLKVLLSSNPLDEQVTLRHSGDYAGHPELYEFQWRYGFPTDGTNPTITSSNIDSAASTSTWLKPDGTFSNSIVVGGSPTAAISNPAVLMGDTYFTMAYRKIGDTAWSDWMQPKLVEGWIKRVLAKITPFNQRMTDLYNNEVNTDVSLLTQAGKRWEGDIALNLANVNDAGLIEIYETILNRGKNFTIGSGIDFTSSNSALILAAGYLNDLYTILGNEAYADAANPTISIDDQTTVTEVNTSRFSFEGQVSSSLEEELALLRGRDDFANPGVATAPAYNRLWWNYTRGINSGEVLYATNYNIKEKVGSSTANGVVDAADAQRMFPQGHGDAYGHYLTALKGYYKLLEHPYFTWTTTSEDVSLRGKSIQIDYKDERKFAAAAANVAMSAQQIVNLVHRQSYKDDTGSGWSQFRDGKINSKIGVTRNQGLDEWVSRSAQGSFLHWVSGNALLPDKDNNPNHTGVQIIDRSTVPELNQLVSAASIFQGTIDSANAHLNPLGLSPGAIAFDISPSQLKAGYSHFEQIYDRALRATLNAKGAFNQAAKMTRLLRNQENQIGDENTAIVGQEEAYVNQLTDIFGSPYGGDIGVGKTYAQGYSGPDIMHWFVCDKPTDLVDTSAPVTISLKVPTGIANFSGDSVQEITLDGLTPLNSVTKTVTVKPNQNLQWSSDWSSVLSGQRASTGRLQQALLDCYQARLALMESNQKELVLQARFKREYQLFNEMVAWHSHAVNLRSTATDAITTMQSLQALLEGAAAFLDANGDSVLNIATALAQVPPTVVGLANDPSSVVRAGIQFAGAVTKTLTSYAALATRGAAMALDSRQTGVSMTLDKNLEAAGFQYDEGQRLYEFEQLYRKLLSCHFEVAQLATDYQRTNQQVANVLVEGQQILTNRESYRQRAAAKITGYRTKDLTFRTFRNEALEQYRALFDLAGRYTYLAAKSYDYETGLLGTTAGKAVIANIVASRSLGDLTDNVPQATVSTLGDAGLAGTMAQLSADFSVAKGRLGINNPDPYGTLFSLRGELFRILNDDTITSDDDAWKQTMQQYIVPNVMADPDVAKYCNNLKKPDGSAAPGIVIPFGSTIQHGMNFFGLPLAANDHAYTPSSYATKISSVGIVLKGYVGMDPYAFGTPGATSTSSTNTNSLSATPYVYLIPCGSDSMLAPPLGDTNTLRTWTVHDQALPLPYNLGASAFNTTQFFNANGTLSEQPWILRKHQAFRPVSDAAFFYSSIPSEFTNTRLIGRSAWNGQWKIVIPAYTLLTDEQDGLNRFVASVKDIQLFLRTYSNSGN